jgi:hypothetical protein
MRLADWHLRRSDLDRVEPRGRLLMAFEDVDAEFCSILRSYIDDGVWICNRPYVDVITGLQASTSLRKTKRYVEEVAARQLDYGKGRWERTDDGGWSYYPES